LFKAGLRYQPTLTERSDEQPSACPHGRTFAMLARAEVDLSESGIPESLRR
jgi:hypothetical protein